jgi:hypothetical protein
MRENPHRASPNIRISFGSLCGGAGALFMDGFDMRLAVQPLQLCDKQDSPLFDSSSHLVKHHMGSRGHCSYLGRGCLRTIADFANMPTRSRTCLGLSSRLGVTVVSSDELPPEVSATVAQISQGDSYNVRIRMHDRTAALEKLARALGMFKDHVVLDGKIHGVVPVLNVGRNNQPQPACSQISDLMMIFVNQIR